MQTIFRHGDDTGGDIVDLFKKLRYDVSLSENSIIFEEIIHQFRWRGYEDRFWKQLAPFINSGYIAWVGEDNYIWRYIFKNGEMSVMSEDAYVSQRTFEILSILEANLYCLSGEANERCVKEKVYLNLSMCPLLYILYTSCIDQPLSVLFIFSIFGLIGSGIDGQSQLCSFFPPSFNSFLTTLFRI